MTAPAPGPSTARTTASIARGAEVTASGGRHQSFSIPAARAFQRWSSGRWPRAERDAGPHRLAHVGLGGAHRGFDVVAEREPGGDGRGERAARAMRVHAGHALAAISTTRSPSTSTSTMSARSRWPPLTTTARAPMPRNAWAARTASSDGADRQPGEHLGLGHVGGHHPRQRQQPAPHGVDRARRPAGDRRSWRPSPGRRPGCGSRSARDRRRHRVDDLRPWPASRSSPRRSRGRRPPPRSARRRTSAGATCTPVTATVFWAVRAVMAEVP